MLRQHAMRDIDKDLQSVAAIRLAALRRAARFKSGSGAIRCHPQTLRMLLGANGRRRPR